MELLTSNQRILSLAWLLNLSSILREIFPIWDNTKLEVTKMRSMEEVYGFIASIILLVIIGVYLAFGFYYESKTFNKLTGAETTMFDAMWVDLRVDCQNVKPVIENK
jgi:hypothetical protein